VVAGATARLSSFAVSSSGSSSGSWADEIPAVSGDVDEYADSPGVLLANRGALMGAVGATQEEPSCRSGRPNDDPSLVVPIVGHCLGVFDDFEPEGIDEEPDRPS